MLISPTSLCERLQDGLVLADKTDLRIIEERKCSIDQDNLHAHSDLVPPLSD